MGARPHRASPSSATGTGAARSGRLGAGPVEGAAKPAVLEFVAGWLGGPRRELKLLRGEKSRRKTLWVPCTFEQVTRIAAGL